MRPIDKGPCPKTPSGVDKTVTSYGEWRADLIARIGYYCAYCNMPLSYNLNVEHVVPKIPVPGATAGSLLDWENMLLACGPCNNAKSNKPSGAILHYLPEYHNGLLAFAFEPTPKKSDALIAVPHRALNPVQNAKASVTIKLFNLDNVDLRDKVVDIRWQKRYYALIAVKSAKGLLDMAKGSPTFDANEAASWIADLARGIGFFALWHEVFHDEPEVLRALCDASRIPGSVPSCFHRVTFAPIGRNPGHPDDI